MVKKIDSAPWADTVQKHWKKSFAKTWSTTRSESVGASEIFDCSRKVAHRKQVGEPEQDQNGYASRGDILENHWLAPLFESIFGDSAIGFRQDNQLSLRNGKASATPDGMLLNPTVDSLAEIGITPEDLGMDVDQGRVIGTVLNEFKTHSPSKNVAYSAPRNNVAQTVAQMEVAQGDESISKYPTPERVILTYCNADNIFDLNTYIVNRDPIDVVTLADSILDVPWYEHYPSGKMLGQCDYCHLAGTSDCEGSTTTLKQSNMFIESLDTSFQLRQQVKTLTEDYKEIDAKIMQQLISTGSKNAQGLTSRVTVVRRNLKPKLKVKKAEDFIRQHVPEDEVGDFFGSSTTSDSLRYSVKKD